MNKENLINNKVEEKRGGEPIPRNHRHAWTELIEAVHSCVDNLPFDCEISDVVDQIEAIVIEVEDDSDNRPWPFRRPVVATAQPTAEELHEKLDFIYHSSYGGQELFGCVWLKDGSWMTRGEYDGSEWWEHNKRPKHPNFKKLWEDEEAIQNGEYVEEEQPPRRRRRRR